MALPILNYPDYLVYENGQIWSNKTKKFLKPSYTKSGYATVELFNEFGSKRLLIHRLVASAFIPNPNNLPQVNHKDENPKNNAVENLEWCTALYNMNYGEGAKTRHLKIDYTKEIYKRNAIINGRAVSVPVYMYSKNGTFIRAFKSIVEASQQTKIHKTNIARASLGKRKTAGGYIWKRERSEDLSVYQY